jgi:hypothetical protein
MAKKPKLPYYGLMAEFTSVEGLTHATEHAYHEGYRNMDAFSPIPVEEVSELLAPKRDPQALIVLVCAILGGGTLFLLQLYINMTELPFNIGPLNIGGKPFYSWPSFIPPTYEATILLAGFGATFGMLALNGLPRLYHPVFNVPNFNRATTDRFFLCIEAIDPQFDRQKTQTFLEGLHPVNVAEVPH